MRQFDTVLEGLWANINKARASGKKSKAWKNDPKYRKKLKKAVKKSDARPFKAAEDTIMMVVDPKTGQKAKFSSKNTIIEVFKNKNVVNGKVLYSNTDRLDSNNILKFY